MASRLIVECVSLLMSCHHGPEGYTVAIDLDEPCSSTRDGCLEARSQRALQQSPAPQPG
jgi:hypothetical protein